MAIFISWFIFWLILAVLVGAFASTKGRSGVGFFFIAILLSPLIGFFIALVMQPDTERTDSAAVESGKFRKCPFCAELVRSEAIICKHCGKDLPALPVLNEGKSMSESLQLCQELRRGDLTSMGYEKLANAAGGVFGYKGFFVNTWSYTYSGEVTNFNKWELIRPWFIDNVVPIIEGDRVA